jgi:hypothetical protein
MPRYFVYEANPEQSSFALQDSDGHCHVARSLDAMPQIGSKLEGSPPQLGSGTLQCADSGRDYPVMFDVISCDRQATLEHLHPRVVRGVTAAWREVWLST